MDDIEAVEVREGIGELRKDDLCMFESENFMFQQCGERPALAILGDDVVIWVVKKDLEYFDDVWMV